MTTITESVGKIIGSASKLVFLLIAATACGGFIAGALDPKDFMTLAGMAFAFYFSNKGEPTAEYAGK